MIQSPFTSPSKALSFVVIAALGGLFLADVADNVPADGVVSASQDGSADGQNVPQAAAAPASSENVVAIWEDAETGEDNLDFEIADYQPREVVIQETAPAGRLAFAGTKQIVEVVPPHESRIVN